MLATAVNAASKLLSVVLLRPSGILSSTWGSSSRCATVSRGLVHVPPPSQEALRRWLFGAHFGGWAVVGSNWHCPFTDQQPLVHPSYIGAVRPLAAPFTDEQRDATGELCAHTSAHPLWIHVVRSCSPCGCPKKRSNDATRNLVHNESCTVYQVMVTSIRLSHVRTSQQYAMGH